MIVNKQGRVHVPCKLNQIPSDQLYAYFIMGICLLEAYVFSNTHGPGAVTLLQNLV